MKQLRPLLVLLIVGAFWFGSQELGKRAHGERSTWPKTEDQPFLPPPGGAALFSLGYRELAADLTWCRALVYYGSSLTGETDLHHLERFVDTIIELDPRFKRVYRWAAYAVTYKDAGSKMNVDGATQAEYRASARYLERAIQEFPDGYELYWLAGLRYYLDLKSEDPAEQARFKERGVELIEQAMRKSDAPRDLGTLAASLRTRLGQKERALHDLKEMVLSTDDAEARQKLLSKIGVTSGDLDMVDEVAAARDALDQANQDHARNLPPDFFVLLGPPPPAVIDWRRLAADRDLVGAEDPTQLWHR
jgi:hypothetical protein